MNKSTIPIVIFAIFLIVGILLMIPGLIFVIMFASIQDYDAAPFIIGAIFTFIGMIFCWVSGVGLYLINKNKKQREMLKQTGIKITADYVETIVNETVHIQYRHPYNIICEWNNPADGKKYIFKSGNIWFNPDNLIMEKGMSKFDVYYDEKNIRNYTVDVDCLTKDVVDLS